MRPRPTPIRPAQLDGAQQAVYDAIIHGSRGSGPQLFPLVDDEGRLQGPFDAMLRSPEVGSVLQSVGAAVRYRTAFTPRTRELAILAVAAHWGSSYEQYAHGEIGRNCGLTEEQIGDVASGRTPELDDPVERCVFTAARALVTWRDLDDRTYDELIGHLGERGLFELTTLVGYYSTIALQLKMFGVEGPTTASGSSD
jgi:4-carboxymuconolactone decarboxylase